MRTWDRLSALAAGIDPLTNRNAERMAARAAELHTRTFKQVLDQLLDSHGDKWRQKHAAQYRNSMATASRCSTSRSAMSIPR